MATQSRNKNYWATKNFNPGGTDTIDLPLGLDVEALHLYLSGAITNSVAYTGIKSEGLSKLIKKIEILLNGETIATTTFDFVVGGNFPRNGGVIRVNPAIGAVATSGEAVGFLDFAHIGGVRQKDSSLVTMGARQLQMRITWGALADMYVGAGTTTSNTLKLDVAIYTTKEMYDENGLRILPEFKRRYRWQEFTYSANKVDRIMLDPDVLYKGLVLRTELGSAADLSNAVLNNIKVQFGDEVPVDLPAAMMVDANTQDIGWSLPVGFYVVDFSPAPHGLAAISDFLNTTGQNGNVFLLLDVNGNAGAPNKVQMLSHQFEVSGSHIEHNRAVKGIKR